MPLVSLKIPKTVWLFGKGPSLDTFDFEVAGKCRIAINEAAFVVPKLYAAIAYDHPVLRKYKERLDSNVIVLRKYFQDCYTFPKMHLVECPGDKHYSGTAPLAVYTLAKYGARVIHFVGFDSINGGSFQYAKSVDAGTNKDGFSRINKGLKEIIANFDLIAIWEHMNEKAS